MDRQVLTSLTTPIYVLFNPKQKNPTSVKRVIINVHEKLTSLLESQAQMLHMDRQVLTSLTTPILDNLPCRLFVCSILIVWLELRDFVFGVIDLPLGP